MEKQKPRKVPGMVNTKKGQLLKKGSWHVGIPVLLGLICILSLALLIISCLCLSVYHLHILTLASESFLITPVIMIICSSFVFVFSIVSAAIVTKKVLTLQFLVVFFSIFLFIVKVIATILALLLVDNGLVHLDNLSVEEQLLKTVTDNSTEWDTLQMTYQCCGGRGEQGFHQWDEILNNQTYPDSCCTVKYPYCGREAHKTLGSDFANTLYQRIHTKGCLTPVAEVLQDSIRPLLITWGVLGTLVAIGLLGVAAISIQLIQKTRRSQDINTEIPHQQLQGRC